MTVVSRLPIFLLLTMVCLPGQQANADELLMRDGSHLLGKLIKLEGAKLEFETSYAGVIRVKWKKVSELHTDEPMKLMLKDGNAFTVQHIRNGEAGILLDDNNELDLFRQLLTQSELEFINPEPWRTGDGYKLDGHINFAIERERGNTDKDELDVDMDLTWRSRHYRFKTFGEFERDRNNNKKIKDKWKLNNDFDHFISRKRYIGVALDFEQDQFADLALRAIVGPKTGYQWFESTDLNLSTEIGPMYVRENFETEPDDNFIALGLGVNFDKYVFDEFMQFYHRQNGLWSLENSDDIVWNSWTGLRFPLVYGAIISTEIRIEYDTRAVEDADELDTKYTLKLGYTW